MSGAKRFGGITIPLLLLLLHLHNEVSEREGLSDEGKEGAACWIRRKRVVISILLYYTRSRKRRSIDALCAIRRFLVCVFISVLETS